MAGIQHVKFQPSSFKMNLAIIRGMLNSRELLRFLSIFYILKVTILYDLFKYILFIIQILRRSFSLPSVIV